MRKAIAIDFDGCLCTNAYPEIGEPNWPVIRRACKKPAARYEPGRGWMHFTKTGSVWHKEKPGQNPKRLGF